MYSDPRESQDTTCLTKKDMAHYLALEAKVNVNKVRELLLAIKQNNLSDHQKRGLLMAYERITKTEVVEEIVK